MRNVNILQRLSARDRGEDGKIKKLTRRTAATVKETTITAAVDLTVTAGSRIMNRAFMGSGASNCVTSCCRGL